MPRLFLVVLAVILAGCSSVRGTLPSLEDDPMQSSRLVTIDGITMHYREYGTPGASPVLLIHGASANLKDLEIAFMPEIAEERHILLVDRPGLGRSERPSRGHDPRIQAKYIKAVADHVGLQKPIVLGHSFGGAVALTYALEFPDDLAGMVLLAPASHPWKGGNDWYNDVAATPIIGHIFSATIMPLVGPGLARSVIGDEFPENYYEDADIGLLFRPAIFRANAKDLTRLKAYLTETFPKYDTIRVPTIILADEFDTVVGTEIHAQRVIKQVEDSELRLMPDGTHFLPHTKTEDIFQALRDMEEKVGRR